MQTYTITSTMVHRNRQLEMETEMKTISEIMKNLV